MFNQNANTNNITVTRVVTPNAPIPNRPKIPFTQCCPGVWIEAVILLILVVGAVVGFIKSVKSFKD